MNEKISVPEIYGMNVFNDAMMREHLPKKVYEELQELEEAAKTAENDDIEGEFGDILFALVNISRVLNIIKRAV